MNMQAPVGPNAREAAPPDQAEGDLSDMTLAGRDDLAKPVTGERLLSAPRIWLHR